MLTYYDSVGVIKCIDPGRSVKAFTSDTAVLSEAKFKKNFITYFNKYYSGTYNIYEIENGEKEAGMPDLLVVSKLTYTAWFFELKAADKNGRFKFERTQPRWYANNRDMQIGIFVYVPRVKTFVHIDIGNVMAAKKLDFRVEVLDEQYNVY